MKITRLAGGAVLPLVIVHNPDAGHRAGPWSIVRVFAACVFRDK